MRTAPIYTLSRGLIRDTRGPTREIGLWYEAEPVCSVLVTSSKSYGESDYPGTVYELKYTAAEESVGFLIRESYFSILVSGSEGSEARVSSREFNSIRLAPLSYCHGNVTITGLKQSVFDLFRRSNSDDRENKLGIGTDRTKIQRNVYGFLVNTWLRKSREGLDPQWRHCEVA